MAIVLDIGSYYTKYNFNTEDYPSIIKNNVCYYPKNGKYHNYEIGYGKINTECIKPIVNGIIKDWDNMEKILDRIIYYDLDVHNLDHIKIFDIQPNYIDKKSKDKIMEILFEKINIGYYQSASRTICNIIGSRQNSALFVDIGNNTTRITPIYENNELIEGVLYSGATGDNITNYISNTLNIPYEKADYVRDLILSKNIKSSNILNIDDIINQYINPSYHLDNGICDDIFKSIKKTNISLRTFMKNNIIITGYITKSIEFRNTLHEHIINLGGNVLDIRDSEILSWKGGKILSKLSSYQTKWVSKNDYYENN